MITDELKAEGSIILVFGTKSKSVPWLDLIRVSDFFYGMKHGSSDNSKELPILDVKEEEFEAFLQFFSPPENLKVSLSLENIGPMTALADRFLCPVILGKCRQFIRRRIYNKETSTFDRTFLINLCFKYFPEVLKEDTLSRIKISQIDLGALHNYESVRPIIFEAISKIKEQEKAEKNAYMRTPEYKLQRYENLLAYFRETS